VPNFVADGLEASHYGGEVDSAQFPAVLEQAELGRNHGAGETHAAAEQGRRHWLVKFRGLDPQGP